MAIYKGNKKVVAVYKGSTPINKIYKGSTLVFQKSGGGGNTQSIEGTATGNFNISINDNSIPITPDADGKWFYETDETITSLAYVFAYKSAVTSVDLSNFDLTDISAVSMFAESPNITSIKFNTTKIIKAQDIYQMFYKCSSLVSVDLSSFDTSDFTTLKDLFGGCSSLVSLNLSSFDTSKVISTMGLFKDCSSLVSLDLSNFNMSKVRYYNDMFKNCTSLSTIKCKQTFKNWCSSKKSAIGLTNYSTINWEIVN